VAWLRAPSTGSELFVDRDDEQEELRFILNDLLHTGLVEARVLVTGRRGVGKSIFTRKVFEQISADRPNKVIPISVDARGIGFRHFLDELGRTLCACVPRFLPDDRVVQAWLDELALLANHHQITRSQADTVARKYGVFSEVGAALFAALKARFTWEETRTAGRTEAVTQQVTDELLRAGIEATLGMIAERGFTVLLFLDDLDQAATPDPERAKETLKHLLDLRPCISLVHLRTESLFEDVRREITQRVELTGLPPERLWQMIEVRLGIAASETQARVRANKAEIMRLARGTDNPYVFLRWVNGLLRTFGCPAPADWHTQASLERIALHEMRALEPELIRRLATVVDRCATVAGDGSCRHADLLRGGSALDPTTATLGPADKLSDEAIAYLKRQEILVPVNRFDAEPAYRLDPVLDLVRPSVAARIAS